MSIKFDRSFFKKMFKHDKLMCLQQMISLGLLRNSVICECGQTPSLQKKSRCIDGYIWVCNSNGHRKETSVRSDSFFEGFKKPLEDIMVFLFFWSKEDMQSSISSYLNLNKNTVSEWCLNCRIVCQESLIVDSDLLIGGLSTDGTAKIVEIDESHFFKRKYNVGREVEAQWVFGMIERDTGKCVLVAVPDISASTLLPIIERYVRAGTIIISDKWRAYNSLRNHQDYTHRTINHSINFVDPELSSVHTQNIENLWLHVKRRLKIQYGTNRDMLDGYLCKFMFKRLHKDKKTRFNYLLLALAAINY